MSNNSSVKISHNSPLIRSVLQQELLNLLQYASSGQEIVIVCIGTDRSTGDCLGPLVGTHLTKYRSTLMHVYGSIAEPVHALNLQQTMDTIKNSYRNPFVIGIDACLGQASSVGFIQANLGPVRPGAGVNKELPPVGNMHITGVVNVGGFMEYFVLQNTRLHLVMSMADIIAQCLYHAIAKRYRNNSEDDQDLKLTEFNL
ncbi:spore protease YyaC [Paenibacillus endoradicis]|uniref:spore protease YyaC n=1 Tax=Paenibacillus endoradicis TaxID=2972487 RepID=UPI0021595D28|nr:spore protease YyaC [Paenibacillus endoradicis]MCR8658483.1 spore protease YyaC [Paenibacillus endoradicis]